MESNWQRCLVAVLLAAFVQRGESIPPFLQRRAAKPLTALPLNATAEDLRWQPSMDFDKNGCYNVPAIDKNGNISPGLPHDFVSPSSNCHDLADLLSNNVYSRQRCNNGWCAYLYDYYFEKDVAIPYFIDIGHKYDWEHIAVWVRDGKAQYVAASQHGEYLVKAAADVRWDGEHPKMVYHKDGSVGTHCFRFATAADDAIENDLGVWFRGDLVSYNGFPPGIREKLYAHDFGDAHIALTDSSFPGNLGRAKPKDITFDTGLDEGSPGVP